MQIIDMLRNNGKCIDSDCADVRCAGGMGSPEVSDMGSGGAEGIGGEGAGIGGDRANARLALGAERIG